MFRPVFPERGENYTMPIFREGQIFARAKSSRSLIFARRPVREELALLPLMYNIGARGARRGARAPVSDINFTYVLIILPGPAHLRAQNQGSRSSQTFRKKLFQPERIKKSQLLPFWRYSKISFTKIFSENFRIIVPPSKFDISGPRTSFLISLFVLKRK